MKKNLPNEKIQEEITLIHQEVNDQAVDFIDEKMEELVPVELPEVHLPTFPNSVYESLPPFLQKVVARCDSPEDRDMILLGSMVALGSCLTKVYGRYGGKRVYPNLYLFITAQASAGKGNLVYCSQLVNLIHEALRELTRILKKEYKIGMKQYNLMKWKEGSIEKPDKPLQKMLFIPANNSASGICQLLAENDGRGLIFETEGDTLTNAFQSQGGLISDVLRKGSHHERISFHRRTDHEHVEIKGPCISLLLAGTNKQVHSLIPNAENGLLSRFIFYHMNMRCDWKDMLSDNYKGMEEYFDALGLEFYSFYKVLARQPNIEFSFSPSQRDEFNEFFIQLQRKYIALLGMDYMATIRRLALIAFRLAMIMTAMRIKESNDFSPRHTCRDCDFQGVLSMIRVLVQHSSHVFSQLPGNCKSSVPKNKKEQFLELLPQKFGRKDFIEISRKLNITERTAQTYIGQLSEKGLILHEQFGSYINMTYQGAAEKKKEESG